MIYTNPLSPKKICGKHILRTYDLFGRGLGTQGLQHVILPQIISQYPQPQEHKRKKRKKRENSIPSVKERKPRIEKITGHQFTDEAIENQGGKRSGTSCNFSQIINPNHQPQKIKGKKEQKRGNLILYVKAKKPNNNLTWHEHSIVRPWRSPTDQSTFLLHKPHSYDISCCTKFSHQYLVLIQNEFNPQTFLKKKSQQPWMQKIYTTAP